MNPSKDNSVFDEALRKFDAGVPVSEILASHKQHEVELKIFFETIERITDGTKIAPRRELLSGILETPVTKTDSKSYIESRGESKGRTSHVTSIVREIEHMLNKKVILPVGVIALLVIVFVGMQLGGDRTVTLSNLTDDEVRIDTIGADLDGALDASLDDVDAALDEATNGTGGEGVSGDALDLAGIDSELEAVDFDSEFDAFFDDEIGLDELDSALSDF